MEQDRERSQALTSAERERAIRVFSEAFSLFQAGEFEAAKLGFERGLALDPGNGDANYYLGEILARRGDDESALARYRRSVFFDPDSAAGLKAEVAATKLQSALEKRKADAATFAALAEEQKRREAELTRQNLQRLRELRKSKTWIDEARCADYSQSTGTCARYQHENKEDAHARIGCVIKDWFRAPVKYSLPIDDLLRDCSAMKHVIRSLHPSVQRDAKLTQEVEWFVSGAYPFGTWDSKFPAK
jgi:tetratricopeptide (TPR) repeat protein